VLYSPTAIDKKRQTFYTYFQSVGRIGLKMAVKSEKLQIQWGSGIPDFLGERSRHMLFFT
jgi:hypothetical protein